VRIFDDEQPAIVGLTDAVLHILGERRRSQAEVSGAIRMRSLHDAKCP
jgi:hypothetical protein